MNPLNKQEATGIFVSIAIMALALAFLRFNTEVFTLESSINEESNVATVIATRDISNDEKELERNLNESTDSRGSLDRLIVEDVRLGQGVSVKDGDTVTVNYIGTTQDGTRFDSSYERGEPFVFTVGRGIVIKGWDEGLLGMKVGGQRILAIPSEMGYGNMRVGTIPPNTPLVFAVELLEIN